MGAIRTQKVQTVLCFHPSEPRKCRQLYVFSHPNPESADSSMFSAIRTQKVPTVLCFQPSEPRKCRQLYVFSHPNPESADSCMFSAIPTLQARPMYPKKKLFQKKIIFFQSFSPQTHSNNFFCRPTDRSTVRTQKVLTVVCFQPSEPRQ